MIGLLSSRSPADDKRLLAFAQALAKAGFIEGHNVPIDYRWGAGDPSAFADLAAELVALAPDRSWLWRDDARAMAAGARTIPTSSRVLATRSAPALSRACLGRAATSPVQHVRMEISRNGWSCLRRSRPRDTAVLFFANPELIQRHPVGRHSDRRAAAAGRGHPVNAAAPATSRALSRPLRARRMAADSRLAAAGSVFHRDLIVAGGPPQAAHGLLSTCFRRLRRAHVLWG